LLYLHIKDCQNLAIWFEKVETYNLNLKTLCMHMK